MSDVDASDLDLIAWAKGAQETSRLLIDRSLAGVAAGGRVMVQIGDKNYSGDLSQFDGERLVIVHDMGSVTIIWVKSGVALTTIEDSS